MLGAPRPSRARVPHRSTSPAPTARARSRRWSTPPCARPVTGPARYTSPHLIDLSGAVRHRRPAGQSAGAASRPSPTFSAPRRALLTRRRPEAQPTFFEVDDRRRRSSCSAAPASRSRCVEVGLGGRLDATNVVQPGRDRDHVDRPRPPAATSARRSTRSPSRRPASSSQACRSSSAICLEPPRHVHASIDARRAGSAAPTIVRGRRRVARSSAVHDRPRAEPIRSAMRWSPSSCSTSSTGRGSPCPRTAVAHGLARPGWPGRLERRRPVRRPRGAARRRAQPGRGAPRSRPTSERRPEVRAPLVFAAMRDKDVDGMLAALLPAVEPARRDARLERALGRSGRLASAGAREPPMLPVTIAESAARRARRSPGASRRASSSPDRSSCSAT